MISLSCTSDDISSGGTDIANSYAEIHVVDGTGSSVENINVTLTGVIITESGDSNFYSQTTSSDINGIAKFNEIPNGYYATIATDSVNKKGAILSKFSIEGDSIIVSKSLTLKNISPLKGRIANKSTLSNVSIVVPGMPGKITPDANGFYIIDNMFKGEYDICFISDSIVNYLNISVKDSVIDTIYIRDINFTELLNDKSIAYDFYEHNLNRSYQIEPEFYAPQDEPAWYGEHDFNLVDYIKSEDDPLYLWRYPLLVGVSDTTLKHFGNDSTVMITLIKDHIKRVSDNFNMADISGSIEFSVDSVYFFSGNVSVEKIAVPSGYNARLLYEAFKDSNESVLSWNSSDRVGTYAISPSDEGGVFGDYGLAFLTAMLGWSRGAFYLTPCEVSGVKNEVNGVDFKLPAYVMNIDDFSNWSSTNSMIINFTGNDIQPSPDIATERLPKAISLRIVDSLLNPVSGVSVDIYVRTPFDNSVIDSIVYTGTSDSNGVYNFIENPFVDTSDTTTRYNNLLIRTIANIDTVFNWFPVIEVIDSCFIDIPQEYTKEIIIPY